MASKNTKRLAMWTTLVVIIALVAVQLVPVDRTNPPVETEVPATAEVRSVLQRGCYGCHSNETAWPWYSRVAPVSWLIAHDVHDGREEMNLSTWNRYTTKQQMKKLTKSWDEVAEGDMPPWYYTPLHPDARLSDHDRALLRAWSQSMGTQGSNGR